MSEQSETNEPKLTLVDQEDLDQLYAEDDPRTVLKDGEEPSYHTILEVWREVLKPAADEATKAITPHWAARMTAQYPQLKVQEMGVFQERYFDLIEELKKVLDLEIATDDEALGRTEAKLDAEENAHHYKNLLLCWQQIILQRELDWDFFDEYAHVEIAVISEVHKVFFSDKGITAYLDNIGFQFTEADSAELQAALEEQREAAS